MPKWSRGTFVWLGGAENLSRENQSKGLFNDKKVNRAYPQIGDTLYRMQIGLQYAYIVLLQLEEFGQNRTEGCRQRTGLLRAGLYTGTALDTFVSIGDFGMLVINGLRGADMYTR